MSPLPGSRDFDAIDAGPLAHTTVNNLQDAIVSGKHGQLVQFIGVDQFMGDDETSDWVIPPGQPFVENLAASAFIFTHAISLPAGTVIERVDWIFDRAADASAAVFGQLENVNANFSEFVTDGATTGTFLLAQAAGSLPLTIQGVQVPSTGGSPPIGPLYLKAATGTEALVGRIKFYGCYITYNKP